MACGMIQRDYVHKELESRLKAGTITQQELPLGGMGGQATASEVGNAAVAGALMNQHVVVSRY